MKSSSESTTIASGPLTNFPENSLQIRAWQETPLDNRDQDPRSLYVEQFWLPILGPSATLLLRRLAMAFDTSPEGFDVDCASWALELGIGMRGGKNGPFWRSIDRACRFGAAQRTGDVLLVRTKLAPLSMHQVSRLPNHLQAAHHAWSIRQIGPVSSKSTAEATRLSPLRTTSDTPASAA